MSLEGLDQPINTKRNFKSWNFQKSRIFGSYLCTKAFCQNLTPKMRDFWKFQDLKLRFVLIGWSKHSKLIGEINL